MTDHNHRRNPNGVDNQFDPGWLEDDPLDDGFPGGLLHETGLPLDELLDRLVRDAELPSTQEMASLSDLSRAHAEKVRSQWPLIPLSHRRALLSQLIEAAVDDLNWQLGRLLRIALDDEDATLRRLAIEGLWEDGEADLIGAYIQILRIDPSEEVRAAAAGALGPFMLAGELDELDASLAMRTEEALLAVLHNDHEPLSVRRRALESIAYSGEVGVRQLIEDGYYSAYEEMRVSALIAIHHSADIRWRNFARAELQSPSAEMRAQAALACGALEATAAREDLIELLGDEEQNVRLAAIVALGQIGGKDAQMALEMMRESEDPDEVDAADLALEELMFFAGIQSDPLYDDALAEADEEDVDPWDDRFDIDDRDLGSYE
ncbi:MAG: HEAT repeat domain-containing protein [Caldilineaceae bacterium]|nr:HEAT repeat domain-containing protein [Caldilineaceae bacterium]